MEEQSLTPHEQKAASKPVEEAQMNQTMECLYSQLISVVPHLDSEEMSSLPDHLTEATNYITKLKARVENLKGKRERLLQPETLSLIGRTSRREFLSAEIAIHQVGSGLQVVLISDESSCQLTFTEIVRVLQEEGVEILSANLSVIGDIGFHIIHSQVGDFAGRDGIADAGTMAERLKKLQRDRYII